ncbi:MAG: hypothetical protein AMJ79_14825 [Phycisphaerae bacterium SM23_30]|nr:MAG: hypothetical protein AMJ79_14825 [Phycisphaerae bacterium SM23_30]
MTDDKPLPLTCEAAVVILRRLTKWHTPAHGKTRPLGGEVESCRYPSRKEFRADNLFALIYYWMINSY